MKEIILKYLTFYYETNFEVMDKEDIDELLNAIEYVKSMEG